MNDKGISRRDFVSNVTTTAVAATLAPRTARASTGHLRSDERLNVAIVGAGSQARRGSSCGRKANRTCRSHSDR